MLREAILARLWRGGSRMPRESPLVKRFGASRPTAARALRTLENEGLVRRGAGSGAYATEGSHARRTASRTLALRIPDLRNTEIFQNIAGEIATLARVAGFGFVCSGSSEARLETDLSLPPGESLCQQFIESRVVVRDSCGVCH